MNIFNKIKSKITDYCVRDIDPKLCCCGSNMGEGGDICAHGGCRSAKNYAADMLFKPYAEYSRMQQISLLRKQKRYIKNTWIWFSVGICSLAFVDVPSYSYWIVESFFGFSTACLIGAILIYRSRKRHFK